MAKTTKSKTKNDINDRYVIIMAGGKGERFWPMSRQKTPKQLITLLGKRSFLQQAVDRAVRRARGRDGWAIARAAYTGTAQYTMTWGGDGSA